MAKTAASEALSDQPESVGRYEIVEPLGRGAMGMVYRARDTVLDREVAVKIMAGGLLQDTAFRARFEREARIVARINHPNVVVVYDLGYHTDDSPFIAMELLSGQDLATVLRTRSLDADDSAAIALQVLAGLARAHQREIVHRDVKPANIFVTEDGKVKVMDFGVARLTASAVTATGAVLGTAYYMSPEQVRGGRVDGRSDVFSVGCVLFEMLASERPFQADDMLGILYQIAHAEPDFSRVSSAGKALVPILERALQKDPALRYHSAPEFARDLRRHLRQHASSPWARQAAEVVELEPGSGSGPVLGARPGTDVEPATEVTKAGSTVSPLGHLVGAPPTAVSDGASASLSPAPSDERPSPVVRLPLRTVGAVGGVLLAVLASLWWWKAQSPAASPESSPAPPPTVAALPSVEPPLPQESAERSPTTVPPTSASAPGPARIETSSAAPPPAKGRRAAEAPPASRPVPSAPQRPRVEPEPAAEPPRAAPSVDSPGRAEVEVDPPSPASAPAEGARPALAAPVARPEPAAPPAPRPEAPAATALSAGTPSASAPPSSAPVATTPPAPPARPPAVVTPPTPSPLTIGATQARRFDGRTLSPVARLGFRVTPDSPTPGGRSSVVVLLQNDGSAAVQVRQIVVTTVSGDDRRSETVAGRTEVSPGQEATLLRRTVSWPSEPPWSMEVVVHTRAGETYTNTVSWR